MRIIASGLAAVGLTLVLNVTTTAAAPITFSASGSSPAGIQATVDAYRAALGTNVLEVNFFVPGTTIPALTRGFGSVFTDVDLANTTSLQFFEASNTSLGTFFVPVGTVANESLSFFGVDFGSNIVSRVRII